MIKHDKPQERPLTLKVIQSVAISGPIGECELLKQSCEHSEVTCYHVVPYHCDHCESSVDLACSFFSALNGVLSQKSSCHIDDHAGHEEHQHWGAPSRKSTRVNPSQLNQLEELDELPTVKAGCPRPLANDPIQWPVQRKPHWLCLTSRDRHRMFCYQPDSDL